eukprot:1161296-Pelagomonas_calceolata.AAC.6
MSLGTNGPKSFCRARRSMAEAVSSKLRLGWACEPLDIELVSLSVFNDASLKEKQMRHLIEEKPLGLASQRPGFAGIQKPFSRALC